MIDTLNLKGLFSIEEIKNSSFRHDISFLRVIAVVAVLFYHFNIFPIRSGFVGVDIFFVISGFLMTKIILTGFDKDNFDLIQFYKKRIVRILPALLALLVIFFVVVYFLVPTQFLNYLGSTYSSSLFFSNVFYYKNSGYFSSDSHNNFLIHTWSLSVEWQFYIIYPIILILLRKVYHSNNKLFKKIFISLVVVSFLSMIYHNIDDNSYSFFIFYTRAWEMLLGGVALLYAVNLENLSTKTKITLSVFCFFILGICLVILGNQNWPSYITIVPVLSTVLIIALNVNFSVFNNKILNYIGNISYSLYLYHWPLFVLSKYFGLNTGYINIIFLLVLSLLLAILSYELIEKKISIKYSSLILGICALIFGCAFSVSKLDARSYLQKYGILTNVTTYYKNDDADRQFNFKTRHFLGEQAFEEFDLSFLKVAETKKNVILLGDSHGGMFAETFENILGPEGINFVQITADATYPMTDSKGFYDGPVDYFNYIFEDYFIENKKEIDLVVICSNYAAYSKRELNTMINFTSQYFEREGIEYLYLGQTQNYPIEFPTYYYMKSKFNVEYPNEDKVFENTRNTNNFLKKKLGDNYIDLLDYQVRTISASNYPYIYDKNHMTVYGTESYRNVIKKNINSALEIKSVVTTK